MSRRRVRPLSVEGLEGRVVPSGSPVLLPDSELTRLRQIAATNTARSISSATYTGASASFARCSRLSATCLTSPPAIGIPAGGRRCFSGTSSIVARALPTCSG